MILPVLIASLAALLPQDARAWGEALTLYQKYSTSRDPLERCSAVDGLGSAVFDKVERPCLQLVMAVLRAEIAREGNAGRNEEKVAGSVLEACLRSLKKLGTKEALAELLKTARAKGENLRVRAWSLWALGARGEWKDLAELAEDKQPIVQIAAVDALAERAAPGQHDLFLKLLAEDRTWEVKLAALRGLEKSADEKLIEPLVEGLGKIRGEQGRLKDPLIAILKKLLDVDLDSDDPNAWRAAISAKKSGDKIPAGTTMVQPTEFYGLKTRSTRLVFILDRTGSMAAPATEPERTVFKLPPEASGDLKESKEEKFGREESSKIQRKWEAVKAVTRMDVVRKEFINTIYVLSPKVHFNVVWFEATPSPWRQELVPATWLNKLDCLREADKLVASGGTNAWDAIELGLRMLEQPQRPGVISVDKKAHYATAIGGPDTIYFMTDGKPTIGRIVQPDDLMAEIKKVNRLRKLTLHAICVGEAEPGQEQAPDAPDPVFLKKLAESTGGEFVHIKK